MVLINEALVDATSLAANTVSRVTFTAINKAASDTLTITWVHDLGSV